MRGVDALRPARSAAQSSVIVLLRLASRDAFMIGTPVGIIDPPILFF
jgi:hypothetical protein